MPDRVRRSSERNHIAEPARDEGGPRGYLTRFGLSGDIARAQSWFVTWVRNHLVADPLVPVLPSDLAAGVASVVGTTYVPRTRLEEMLATSQGDGPEFIKYLPNTFHEMLMALEFLHAEYSINQGAQKRLDAIIEDGLRMVPSDLGVRWENGLFYPAGAEMLDAGLVADPLGSLVRNGFGAAGNALRMAAEALLDGRRDTNQLKNVIRDGYEAIESAAKVTCRNDRDLSGNREQLVKQLHLPLTVGALLKEIVNFANPYRHGENLDGRPAVSYQRAELFLYETGLVLRAIAEASGSTLGASPPSPPSPSRKRP